MPPSPTSPPPTSPQLSVSSLRFTELCFGALCWGGVWPHFLHSSAHLPPPPMAAPPQCLRCGQRGSDPHPDPHSRLCSALSSPHSPSPIHHQTLPSSPQPPPPLLKPTPPPPSPQPPFISFVLLGNVHPLGSAPSTTTPTRSAHGWKRSSRCLAFTPRRCAVPAGPAWPCLGGTNCSWGGYRMVQGFLSLKGFSEAGTPTSRGSLRACCSQ